MEANSKSIKEFLSGARLYKSLSMEKLDYALSLYERLTKTTTVPTGMPPGGGSDRGDVLSGYVDAVDNANIWAEIAKKHRELRWKFVEEVPLPDIRKRILQLRYVYHQPWSEILFNIQSYEKMEIRKLYYEHNRALKDCADWVNETGKYKEEIDSL